MAESMTDDCIDDRGQIRPRRTEWRTALRAERTNPATWGCHLSGGIKLKGKPETG